MSTPEIIVPLRGKRVAVRYQLMKVNGKKAGQRLELVCGLRLQNLLADRSRYQNVSIEHPPGSGKFSLIGCPDTLLPDGLHIRLTEEEAAA